MLIFLTILAYFCCLFAFSRWTSRRATNETFYRGNRQSPWYMVAFGMVGASISGITFVSVPGMVMKMDMTYLQTCLGFIVGYFLVAFLLLPVYYRLNLTTIYSVLNRRLGLRAYHTGAWFFLLSKMTGAAVRFYVVCIILQRFVFQPHGVPFGVTVVGMVCLIWLYTRRGGIKTLVWTDTFQTVCMFTALLLIIYNVMGDLGMTVGEAYRAIADDSHSRMFVFDDWVSRQHFWKQFLSGIFIVIVMTGLDQDMMQKNLTCKTLREAQKDMCTYGFAFVPANLLFMALGVLLVILFRQQGLELPVKGGHRGGFVLQRRQCLDGHDHQLLRGYQGEACRRTAAQARPYRHGRSLRRAYPDGRCREFHQRHRCHLYSLFLHIRSAARSFCIRLADPSQCAQQLCALCLCGFTARLLCLRQVRADGHRL